MIAAALEPSPRASGISFAIVMRNGSNSRFRCAADIRECEIVHLSRGDVLFVPGAFENRSVESTAVESFAGSEVGSEGTPVGNIQYHGEFPGYYDQ